jgi:hypothetical protein
MTTLPPASATGALFPLTPPPPLAAQGLAEGSHTVAIYLLGGTALRDYLRPIGLTAWKVGVTGCREVERRAADCRRKKYASVLKRPGDPTDPGRELADGHEWFVVPMQPDWLGRQAQPEGLALRDGVLRLTMPTSVTVTMVDQALRAMLRPRALHAYLDSPEGQKRLSEAGYDPKARLHTRYTLMTPTPRLSFARELYLIRPQRELPALVTAIDAIGRQLRPQARGAQKGKR